MGFNLNDYETVEDRLHRFLGDHKNAAVRTSVVSDDGTRVLFRAEVYRDRDYHTPCATGHADEVKGQGNVNRTNHVENAETSAIGRALANLGYAPKGARPSREEMTKADEAKSEPRRDTRSVSVTDPKPPSNGKSDPEEEKTKAYVAGLELTKAQSDAIRKVGGYKATLTEAAKGNWPKERVLDTFGLEVPA